MTMALSVNKQFGLGGKQFNETDTIVGNGATIYEELIPKAQPGVQSATGAGTTTGTLTMTNSPHGITTGMIVDIYWTDPSSGILYTLVGALVGTVSGQSVPITLGTYYGGGSDLPVTNTPIVVCQSVSFSLGVTKSNMQALLATLVGAAVNGGTYTGVFNFSNAVPDIEFEIELFDGGAYGWYVGNGLDNPLGANITQVLVSHNNTLSAMTMRVGVLTN